MKDPYTGASIYFTPHCFRHSFATALAPLIGGDAKTGAKILGHSPQAFMRYVRANDETARSAVERMAGGLPGPGEAHAFAAKVWALRMVHDASTSAEQLSATPDWRGSVAQAAHDAIARQA